jgi:hypothetical protein
VKYLATCPFWDRGSGPRPPIIAALRGEDSRSELVINKPQEDRMSRRYTGHMKGERYLGNMNKREVHDLDNEKVPCQIDEVIQAGHDRGYVSYQLAKAAGLDNCAWCIGGSTR